MAKKTDTQVNVDLSKFLPEGFSLDDFEVVGGLRPICPPELNAESPVVGWVVACLPMPAREDGSQWSALLINLVSTAQAKAGDEIVTVEAGRDILIPVGGNLKNNGDLMAAAADPQRVVMGVFQVTGQQDVGKPSKMWVYEVKLALKKSIARTGAFALYNKPTISIGEMANQPIIGANGQPARLVG